MCSIVYLTMLGCSYCFRILPSCRNFFFCSSGMVTLQVFTATARQLFFRRALNTSPGESQMRIILCIHSQMMRSPSDHP